MVIVLGSFLKALISNFVAFDYKKGVNENSLVLIISIEYGKVILEGVTWNSVKGLFFLLCYWNCSIKKNMINGIIKSKIAHIVIER